MTINRKLKLAWILLVTLLVSSCASPNSSGYSDRPEDHYHWRPTDTPHGWAVFLPGSSGLTVLGDDDHYFDAARKLNGLGWDVLLIDYKNAYRAARENTRRETGEKIAWVTEQAVDWMQQNHPKTGEHPGTIVAWSLGAEGAFRIANDEHRAQRMGINAVALYYPSNKDQIALKNRVPILVLTGAADDVTTADDIGSLIDRRHNDTAPVELHIYPDAHHGFDIASITKKKTLRILPLVGPKATFHYNQRAAEDAWGRLAEFLDQYGPSDNQ